METPKDDLDTTTEQAGEAKSSEQEPEFEVGSAGGHFDTSQVGKGSSAVEFEAEEDKGKE